MSHTLPHLTLTTSTSCLSPISSTSPTSLTVSLSQTSPVTLNPHIPCDGPRQSGGCSLTEDMNEFGKVGADTSHLQSQMHSDHDSAESIADSDLEDGERRKNAGFTCICRMEKTMNPLECQSHRRNLLHCFHLEVKNPDINSRVLFSETLTRQIWEDLFLKIFSVKQSLNVRDRNIKLDVSVIASVSYSNTLCSKIGITRRSTWLH